jgi:hypothetical protein
MLVPLALAEAFNKERNACFVGVKKRSNMAQKETETPTIARNEEPFTAEIAIIVTPVIRAIPIMTTVNMS